VQDDPAGDVARRELGHLEVINEQLADELLHGECASASGGPDDDRGGRVLATESKPISEVDQFEHLASKADDLGHSDPVSRMGAEIEGLFDGCHRERPGEAAGTYDKKVDRVWHLGLQSGIGKHPC